MQLPSDWFWATLESTAPSLEKLEEKLEKCSKEELRRFDSDYRLAAESLCDYWSGPVVLGVQYSEDDTEDLCQWIVSQGREFWHQVVCGEVALVSVAEMLERQGYGSFSVATRMWTTEVANPNHRGYQSPSTIAAGIYFARFGYILGCE